MKDVFIAIVTYLGYESGTPVYYEETIVVDRETQCEEFLEVVKSRASRGHLDRPRVQPKQIF